MPKKNDQDKFLLLLTEAERELISRLDSPYAIQEFLDGVTYSSDDFYRCPLRVLRDRQAHCFDGALFAVAALRLIGYKPLALDMIPNRNDDDHILALFKVDDCWGALAKSNFSGLRFREPVYRNLRELVMSYFEQYYNTDREKTLRGYTRPLNLAAFDHLDWMTSDDCLEVIAQGFDEIPSYRLITEAMAARLQAVDERSHQAGLLGSVASGLFKPKAS
jgi:hypothetical protein